MEYFLYILIFSIIGCLIFFRIKKFDKDLNLDLFDGLFFGGVFYTIIPLIYCVFVKNTFPSPDITVRPYDALNHNLGTSFYIFASVITFGVISVYRADKIRKINEGIPNKPFEKTLLFTILILYIVSELIFFVKSGKLSGDSHWYTASEKVYESGVLFTFLGQFNNVGRLFLPAMCMYYEIRYPGQKTRRLHWIVSIIILAIELLLVGNRIGILYVGLSHLIPLFYQRKWSKLAKLSILAVPFYFISIAWPVVRGLIWTEKLSLTHIQTVFSTAFDNKDQLVEKISPVMSFTEGANLFVLNEIYNRYPNAHSFTMGETMIMKPLTTFLPRIIWKDKPQTFGMEMGKQLGNDVEGLVLNPTIIGETWANFGWAGNIILIATLLLFARLKFRNISPRLFNYLCFFVSVAMWRFDFSFFFIALITLIIYLLLSRIFVFKILSRKLFRLSV